MLNIETRDALFSVFVGLPPLYIERCVALLYTTRADLLLYVEERVSLPEMEEAGSFSMRKCLSSL